MTNNTILVYSDSKNNNELKFMSPEVSLRAYKKRDKNKYTDSYLMIFTTLGIKGKQLTKLSSFKILLELQTLLAAIPKEVYVKPNTLYISQKTLARRLEMHRVTVAAGLEDLENAKIIFLDKKYSIVLNPAYFWRGNLVEHQDMMERYFRESLLDKEELTQALEEIRIRYANYFLYK